MLLILPLILPLYSALAQDLPKRFTELLPYVQEAPDQGDTRSCLYVSSTGAMELIANKKAGIKDPHPYGTFDLSESFVITAPEVRAPGKTMWEKPVLKFNRGYGIHISQWPFEPWRGRNTNDDVWTWRNVSQLPKVTLPKVETKALFVKGNQWSTHVLNDAHVLKIKEALWKYKSPVLINYNDNRYWHAILIVGYDDELPGDCFQITEKECGVKRGSFYVRDSFGIPVELRDYDWFRIRGNAAFVIKEAP